MPCLQAHRGEPCDPTGTQETHKADVLPWFFLEELEGCGWGDCPYIFTSRPARDSHSSFTPDINEQRDPTGGRESVIKSWASAQKTHSYYYSTLCNTDSLQLNKTWTFLNKCKIHQSCNKFNFWCKQLCRRQQWPSLFGSIQFSVDSIHLRCQFCKVHQLWNKFKFSCEAALWRSEMSLLTSKFNVDSTQEECHFLAFKV